MTNLTYQEQQMLAGRYGAGRHPEPERPAQPGLLRGDRDAWIATFRHSGATYIRDHDVFTDLRMAFDGGDGQRLVASITRSRSTACTPTALRRRAVRRHVRRTGLRATGIFRDELIYERGGWYLHLP